MRDAWCRARAIVLADARDWLRPPKLAMPSVRAWFGCALDPAFARFSMLFLQERAKAVFEKGNVFGFTLPNYQCLPSRKMQSGEVIRIASLVAGQFWDPVLAP
jgi:hypothetical protein